MVVTRRLCLNRLALADTRRTTATAEPPEVRGGADPADRSLMDEDVRLALSVVIDALTPAERTSFILHDVLGFTFAAWRTSSGGRAWSRAVAGRSWQWSVLTRARGG